VRFQDFEELAWRDWQRIPESYKAGIDGLSVVRAAQPHPGLDDVWTLGECVTEAYPSDFGGPDTIRSAVVLYWGSFRNVADQDPDFDWEHEVWETLTHELRHHLEALADEDALGDVDYAADENFRRWEGGDFDPWFFQRGDRVPAAEGPALEELESVVWRVENDWFVEAGWTGTAPPTRLTLRWADRRWSLEVPEDVGDVAFLTLDEGFEPPDTDAPVDLVEVVLVRRVGLLERLARVLRGRPTERSEHPVAVRQA